VAPNKTIRHWALYRTALAIVLSIGKLRTLTPRGAETREPISIKLEIYDYVRDPTPRDKFGGGSSTWVVWAGKQFVTSFGFFFSICFLRHAYRSHFLTDPYHVIIKRPVIGPLKRAPSCRPLFLEVADLCPEANHMCQISE